MLQLKRLTPLEFLGPSGYFETLFFCLRVEAVLVLCAEVLALLIWFFMDQLRNSTIIKCAYLSTEKIHIGS